MKALQTILDFYNKQEIDLLYDKAVDLISLLDDEQLETFCDQNPRFDNIISSDFKNIVNLREIIDMLVNYLMK